MNINSVNNSSPKFKGYLKFRSGQYVNSKHITSILYDRTDIINHQKIHSSSFMMTDGLRYILKYIKKPDKNLIESIVEANKSNNTIVDIDAVVAPVKVKSDIFESIQNINTNPLKLK